MLGAQPERKSADVDTSEYCSRDVILALTVVVMLPALLCAHSHIASQISFQNTNIVQKLQPPVPDGHDSRIKSCFTRSLDLAEARRVQLCTPLPCF